MAPSSSNPSQPPIYSPAPGAEADGYGFSKFDEPYNDPYDPTTKERPASIFSESEPMLEKKRKRLSTNSIREFFEKRSKIYAQYFLPFYAITIQVVLVVLLWVFFVVTIYQPVPLPHNIAVLAKEHEQSVVLIVSTIATMISFVSTTIFSGALGYALGRFLSGPKPVSLYNVSATVQIIGGSFVWYQKRIGWTIGSSILVCLVAAQTASWTTLLTPTSVPVTATLVGFELDLSNPAFAQMMADNQDVVTPDLFSNSISLITQSGASAVSSELSLPGLLNFNSMSYLNSTGGTLPASWTPYLSTSTSATGTMIPPSLTFTDLNSNVKPDQRKLFPVSFTMTQHGFTASVECHAASLSPTSRPSVSVASSPVQAGANLSISVASFSVGCTGDGYTTLNYNGTTAGGGVGPNKTSEPVLTNSANDAVFAQSCGVSDNEGVYWDLIVVGSGRYSFMGSTICSISPMSTFVNIFYQDSSVLFNSSFPSLINNTDAWNQTASNWLGQFVVDSFLHGVVNQGQSTRGSSLGDVVRQFSANAGSAAINSTQVPTILEAYIRGVMELSVTLLRAAYSSPDYNLFGNANGTIPDDMRAPINGTYNTQTIGWYQSTSLQTAATTLIAPTLISLLTIVIIFGSMWWTSRPSWKRAEGQRGPILPEEEAAFGWFDPSNLFHLIRAASAGGLSGVDFPGYDDDMQDWSGKIGVRLAKVESGPVGFVIH